MLWISLIQTQKGNWVVHAASATVFIGHANLTREGTKEVLCVELETIATF